MSIELSNGKDIMVAKKIRKVERFEKLNCTGKLRVQVNEQHGEISEVILLPKKGGCIYNLELIGRLITAMIEFDIPIVEIMAILESTAPCPAPMLRLKREQGDKKVKSSVDKYGIGGCSNIILEGIKRKYNEISKDKFQGQPNGK